MRRLLVKIGAWLAILLGLAMMLQPTAADWLTRQRNSSLPPALPPKPPCRPMLPRNLNALTLSCTPLCRPITRRFLPTAKAA